MKNAFFSESLASKTLLSSTVPNQVRCVAQKQLLWEGSDAECSAPFYTPYQGRTVQLLRAANTH